MADDAVDLYRINQATLEGRCPELLQNLLEVRGIGLLDIRAIFGETAVRRKMRLKLIVHLVRRDSFERDYERMPSAPLTQDVLGIPVRKVIIQVVAGRNIAVLVEAAVRNSILQLRGIDTYADFVAAPPQGDGRRARGPSCSASVRLVASQGLRVVALAPWLGLPGGGCFAFYRLLVQSPHRPYNDIAWSCRIHFLSVAIICWRRSISGS